MPDGPATTGSLEVEATEGVSSGVGTLPILSHTGVPHTKPRMNSTRLQLIRRNSS